MLRLLFALSFGLSAGFYIAENALRRENAERLRQSHQECLKTANGLLKHYQSVYDARLSAYRVK